SPADRANRCRACSDASPTPERNSAADAPREPFLSPSSRCASFLMHLRDFLPQSPAPAQEVSGCTRTLVTSAETSVTRRSPDRTCAGNICLDGDCGRSVLDRAIGLAAVMPLEC